MSDRDGDPGWRDRLIEGDMLTVAERLLPSLRGGVDLVYLDPPFATESDFTMRAPPGSAPGTRGAVAYRDRWGHSADTFLAYFEPRLTRIRELLAPTGALYLHLDQRRVHHARLLLDRLFGEDCLRNEIIWHYRSGGRPSGAFAAKHDTILAYGKTPTPYFNEEAVALPRAEHRKNHMKRGVDEDGRAYSAIRSNGKEYRYYDDETVIPDDVWSDVAHLHQRSPERTGYPTQKPEKLLERVLLASSPPGGLVLDLCCGSGTTIAVAERLGRRWIGGDRGALAIETTRARLARLRGDRPFDVLDWKDADAQRAPAR